MSAAMKVGTWNVERGHIPVPHARMIWDAFQRERLDALALQEVRDYVDALDDIIGKGAVLFVIDDLRGQNQQATLVRAGVDVGRVWSFAAGDGWRIPGGKMHAGQHPLGVELDGLELVNVHAPVRDGERPAFWRDVRGELRGLGPAVVLGDLNSRPWERGPDAATSLEKHGFTSYPPSRGTGHGPIDWALGRGVRVGPRTVHRHPPTLAPQKRPDHLLVTLDVTITGSNR